MKTSLTHSFLRQGSRVRGINPWNGVPSSPIPRIVAIEKGAFWSFSTKVGQIYLLYFIKDFYGEFVILSRFDEIKTKFDFIICALVYSLFHLFFAHTHTHTHTHTHLYIYIYIYKFTYLGSSVSSTEKDIDTLRTKTWTAIDKLSVIGKSDLTDKMKRSFFQAVVVSILLYGCTTLMLTKRLEKKLDGNVASNIKQVLVATPHKAPTIRPPASHHENYQSWTNQARRTLLEEQG